MTRPSCPPPLQNHKHHRPHHRYEIQRQVHHVTDNRRGCEFLKRLLRQLPQLPHHPASTLDLPSFGDEVCSIFGYKHAVEGIGEGVINEKGLAEDGKEGGGFGEDEEGGADGGQGTGREGHDSHLGQVGEDEHKGGDAEA